MGTTVNGRKRTKSRYRAPEGPVHDYYGERGNGSAYPGWSGTHEQPIEALRKQAIELCCVFEQPLERYFTPINYDDHEVGAIRHTRDGWRMQLYGSDYGPFKTYLGARKAALAYFAGLDIVPLDEHGNLDVSEYRSP